MNNINPTSLDSTKSIYNYETHMPYPTLNYIEKRTGIDMVLGVGSKLQAESTVVFLTELAMGSLRKYHLSETFNVLEWLIAKNEEYRLRFINFVCSIIITTRGKGISELLNSGEVTIESLSKLAQISATGLLEPKKFTQEVRYKLIQHGLRVGY